MASANQNRSPATPLTYHLADVEKRAAQNQSFQIPSLAERRSIPVGHFAKLVFCDITAEGAQPAAERMWVEIIAYVMFDERQAYVGHLANHPELIEGLRFDDSVVFEPKHVAAIVDPADLEI